MSMSHRTKGTSELRSVERLTRTDERYDLVTRLELADLYRQAADASERAERDGSVGWLTCEIPWFRGRTLMAAWDDGYAAGRGTGESRYVRESRSGVWFERLPAGGMRPAADQAAAGDYADGFMRALSDKGEL